MKGFEVQEITPVIVCFILLAWLTACETIAPNPDGSTRTNTVFPEEITALPSETNDNPTTISTSRSPSATEETGETPTYSPLPTPEFPASAVAQGLVLSTAESPECELPCWHGLRIGMSSQSEAETVLKEIFHIGPEYQFAPRANVLNIGGAAYAIGNSWPVEDPVRNVSGAYYFYALFDEQTQILVGIIERMQALTGIDTPGLPEIVLHLGAPTWVLSSAEGTVLGIELYYERGIRVSVSLDAVTIGGTIATFCLNEHPVTQMYLLSDSYPSLDQEELSRIQRMFGPGQDSLPIEEHLGLSINEFVQLVQGSSPCIELPYP